jgi:hypothetical protein
MSKFVILIVNFLSILFLGVLQDANISMQMDVPVVVDAGQEFRVKVTIDKDNLQGFARFQQILPAGLTAISENSAQADFTFKPKRVRLIWLRLPANDVITVVYKVKVDERLKGTFELGGRFSYIENNERKSANLIAQTITIIPSPNINPSETIDIKDFERETIPSLGIPGAESISCIRQKPYFNESGEEIVVNLLVNKLNKEKFAKIEEQVPSGFSAVSIVTKDAIFTYRDNNAKFLWMNLPPENYFVVTYNLIPDAGKSLADLQLKGQFSYIEGDKTMVIDIIEKDVDLVNVTDERIAEILSKQEVTQPKDITPDITQPDPVQDDNEQPDTDTQKDQVIEEPIAENNTKIFNNLSNKNNRNKKYILQPEEGVYYRVQVAAGHRPVNIDRYFRRLKLDADVKREDHEGWLKYSVGSFNIYKEARDYRVHVWNTTEISDAFVAAYNNGDRITVQEALMIANQKWYQ